MNFEEYELKNLGKILFLFSIHGHSYFLNYTKVVSEDVSNSVHSVFMSKRRTYEKTSTMKQVFVVLMLSVTLSSTFGLEYNEMQMSKSKFKPNKTISADYIMHKIEKRAVSSSKFSIHTVLNITSSSRKQNI